VAGDSPRRGRETPRGDGDDDGAVRRVLALYLYRIVVHGTTEFPGDGAVYTFVYLPVLAIHIGLALVAIPLVYYALLLATTRRVREIYDTNHAKVGRVAASLWLVSFAPGIVVYLLLYVLSWSSAGTSTWGRLASRSDASPSTS